MDAVMVSLNDTELIILGGVSHNYRKLCDVTILSTASQSSNGTLQLRTIVENNAAGHRKFYSDSKQVAKVAAGHIVIYGNDE